MENYKFFHEYSLPDVREIVMHKDWPSDEDARQSVSPDNYGLFTKATWDETVKNCFVTGCRKMAEMLECEATKYSALGNAGRTRRVVKFHDIAGELVESREQAGYPDCYSDYRVQKLAGKTIKIVVEQSVSGNITADAITQRGISVYTIIRALEKAGYSVGLSVTATTPIGDRGYQMIKVNVRNPGEYLDPAITAFYLIDPCFLRRIVFNIMEKMPDRTERALTGVGIGYGKPGHYGDFVKNNDEIVIPRFSDMPSEPREQVDFLINLLKAKGIEVNAVK